MFRRRDAEAASSLAAQFTAHQVECTRDKAEIKLALAKQDAERVRLHTENSAKFDKINRIIWVATGAMAALQLVAGNGVGAALLKAMHP